MNDSSAPLSAKDSERITEESVRWAYRLLLGREPESAEVIRQHIDVHGSLRAMRGTFLNSDEFRGTAKSVLPPQSTGHEKPLPIDGPTDPATTQRLLDHIAESWSHYGETEPHWSVLTFDKYLGETLNANVDDFNASGERTVQRFLATMERNGVSLASGSRCLELGCGVGRLTRWLAPHFAHVTGIDVSPGHLRLAQSHVAQFADNVDFFQLRRIEDLSTLPKAQAFFSFLVLQHNPPPITEAVLDQIFARLESGGIAYFHLPTYMSGYGFDTQSYLSERGDKLDMEMHALPQARVFEVAARHGMQPLEVLGETTTDYQPGRPPTLILAHYFLMRKR